ncbi:MAG: hypothetical protein DMG68_01090 [Acidobacteria bacterium]|jgi:hypothetical protein|nr:MAG: hypothetical protein DMG68_01090 [Acidobacteriota bacterium]
MLEYFRSTWNDDWRAFPTWAFWSWTAFFAAFLLYAWSQHGQALFIDSVNLVVHEAGHALFGWFGATLGLWGGTLFQLIVPFLLAGYFFTQRQAAAFAFCLFFLFENFLGIATYMADARAQALPLVTLGDPEFVIHDWNAIFSSLGLLQHDLQIAAVTRFLGWAGMLGIVIWMAREACRSPKRPQ